jgi:hypothetical protein
LLADKIVLLGIQIVLLGIQPGLGLVTAEELLAVTGTEQEHEVTEIARPAGNRRDDSAVVEQLLERRD